MNRAMQISACLAATTGLHAFTIDKQDTSNPQLLMEIIETGEPEPFAQDIIIRRASDHTVVGRTKIYSPSMNGILTETSRSKVLWNASGDRFVLLATVNGVDVAMFVHLRGADSSSQSYFLDGDGKSKRCSDLEGKWISDTAFLFSFTRSNGKRWTDEITVDGGQFNHRPIIINGEPTRTSGSSEPSQSSGR